MTGLAPAPAALIRARRHPSGVEVLLDPARELGAGGEARVYALRGRERRVAKVYHAPTLERSQKLAWMAGHPPALPPGGAVSLAWPAELLTDARGVFAGFVMPFAKGARLFELYNPVTRRKAAPLFHWGLLHRAGANVAAAFEALHAAGYVVGDVNESNLLVSPEGAVTVVDTDSFQVRDGRGALFRSRVGKAEFTPPELQGVSFADVDRAPEHDRFGLAVLLFLALMEGTHPFAARFRPGEEAPPLEARIARGLFPYAAEGAPIRPPRLAPPFEALDPGLRALFVTAFVDGHADPSARPTAAEWRAALEEAEAGLLSCDRNAQHRFGAHLDACPWCARAQLLRGRDPFPATREAARWTELEAPPAPLAEWEAPASVSPPSASPPPTAPSPPAATAAAPVPAPATAPPPPTTLAPNQAFAALVAPPWWAPLLGPDGARHPVAWLLPLLVLGVGAGAMVALIAGLLGLTAVLATFLRGGGIGPVRRTTAMAGLLLALATAGVLAAAYDPPPSPTRIHALDEVDQPARLLNPDAVSQAAREAGVVGQAEVGLVVETDGTVDPASIYVRFSTSPELAQVAARVAELASYAPARIGDVAVRSETSIPLELYTAAPGDLPRSLRPSR